MRTFSVCEMALMMLSHDSRWRYYGQNITRLEEEYGKDSWEVNNALQDRSIETGDYNAMLRMLRTTQGQERVQSAVELADRVRAGQHVYTV